jgi:hypothetical protein
MNKPAYSSIHVMTNFHPPDDVSAPREALKATPSVKRLLVDL